MATNTLETLREGIARGAAAVVSLPSAGMLRHYKTRFLREDENGHGFWVEAPPEEDLLVDELIEQKAAVGIAFKSAILKVVFTTSCSQRQARYQINESIVVPAMLLAFPEQVKTVQRRTDYRVFIPSGSDLSVRVWRIAEHAILRDRPPASLEIPSCIRDLSTGGLSLLCAPKEGEPQRMVQDQRLRISLTYGENEALVEGRARHIQLAPDQSLRVGVQFKKLENDLTGRQTLSKLTAIVGELHRAEVRRMRLNSTPPG